VLGENIFELNKKKSGNNDDSGSESSQIGFSSFGMAGESRFPPWPLRVVG